MLRHLGISKKWWPESSAWVEESWPQQPEAESFNFFSSYFFLFMYRKRRQCSQKDWATVSRDRHRDEKRKRSGQGQSWQLSFDTGVWAGLTLFSRSSRGDVKLREWGEMGCEVFYRVLRIFPLETRGAPTGETWLFTTANTSLIGVFTLLFWLTVLQTDQYPAFGITIPLVTP